MMRNLRLLSGLLALGLLAGCRDDDANTLDINNLYVVLMPVAASSALWTGVAVPKDGRVFATFLRMDTDTIPYSLAMVSGSTGTAWPNAT